MKKISTAALFLSLSLVLSAQAQASVCTLVGIVAGKGMSVDFKPATETSDGEYRVYEELSIGGATFYLKAGHGVARLEAYVGEDQKAAAWNRWDDGKAPLNLDFRLPNGETFDAECSDLSSIQK
jgi:hypothetical protein